MATDLYRTLGLDRSASAKEISTAYRRLARQHHPDVSGGDPASESRFKEINAAHDVLGDDKKRAAYDKWGDQWEHAEQLEEMQRQRGGFLRLRRTGRDADRVRRCRRLRRDRRLGRPR